MMAERFFCNLIFVFQLQLSWLLMGTEARALSLELTQTQLLEFKRSSVASDPSGFLTDWAPSSSNLCTWRGVLCSSDGSVVGLDLTNAGLSGTLHLSHLTSLPSLKHLYFYGNFFSAGELSPLDDASSCGLETLDLSSNRLSDGALLRDILSKCHSLKFLNLSDNKLSGSMDDISISSCENLSTLDLSGNFLSGEIPPDFVADSPPSLTSLNLSHNNLSGDFSSLDFGTCNNLTLLNLGHNGLSGTQFPVGLFECELLETLDLSHNRLQSNIPGVLLGTLENLRRLSLSYNQFSGGIPVELGGNCGTLEELDLSGNNLSGGFPATFLSCRELWSLNLGHNQLTGDFLTTVVSHLPSLQYLYLQFNNLTGPIPPSLTNCTKLRVLDLSSNAFTGNILSGFCTSSSPSPMEKLLLANNRLQGNVPAELSKCRNLKSVDFSFNNITGPIPLEIWTLPDISDVIMWANSLSGAIPEGICLKGGNLRTLILNNNFITGTIPPSIVNCTNMIWISLSSNRLAGEIPAGIGDLVDLAILQMGNNSLSGKIPSELGNCRSLIWLDLNSNNLSGSIPPDLANQAGLVSPGNVSGKQFAFVRNEGGTGCRGAGGLVEFEGIRRESLELYRMVHSCPSTRIYSGLTMYTFTSNGSIIYLDFSYNSLSGSIPETFGSMSYMQVLNLGHNNLTGKIPDSFGGMKAIGVLDLSHNHIEGPIPGSLGSLSFLSDLDVSNNNLSGTIPSGGQLTTFPTSRYENNSGLCGVPLLHCGSGTRSRRPLGSSSPHNNQPLAAAVAIGILLSLICIMLLTLGLHRIRKHQQEEGKKREKFIESLSTSGSSSWKLSSIPEPLSINVATFENPLRKLTFAHLLEATNGFSAESLIGSGGFGEVYKAQLKDGSSVAIKKLIHVTGQGDREFMAEMETIGKIKHRNLVPLLGYCKVGDERLLVYEYMRWGSLESVLHEGDKRRGRKLDFAARKRIAIGSARGLAFLHHSCIPHIIHRDMKSSNVLLDESFEARVSDFGMARLVNALDSHLSVSTLAGTPGYVPPEYYQSFRCTTKGDVYSYGVILLELLSGKRPIDPQEFGDDNNIVGWAKQLYKERRESEILDKELIKQKSESELCRRYLKIAFECLDDRPFRRPTMIQVMAMFKDLQVDTDGDILDEFSIKDAVIEEPQLISFNSDGSTKNFASTSLLVS